MYNLDVALFSMLSQLQNIPIVAYIAQYIIIERITVILFNGHMLFFIITPT